MPYYLQLEDNNCSKDFLELRDGPIQSSPLIGKYCGKEIPKYINSTGRHLFVKFVSDDSVEDNGFSARYFKGQYVHLGFWISFFRIFSDSESISFSLLI